VGVALDSKRMGKAWELHETVIQAKGITVNNKSHERG